MTTAEQPTWVVDRLISDVARRRGLEPTAITGRSRQRRIVHARAEVAHRLYYTTDLRLREIGDLLGGRDHSTISYLIASHELRHPR